MRAVKGSIDDAKLDNLTGLLAKIREKSPTIKAQLDAGTVGLVGAIYDVSTGKVTFLPD